MSKHTDTIRAAFDAGYFVTEDGKVIGPSGCEVKVYETSRWGYRVFKPYFTRYPHSEARPISVSKFQAYQLFGEDALADGIQVRHLDGDPTNDSDDNIAIGTPVQNAQDKPSEVRHRAAVNAGRARSSLTEEDVRDIRKMWAGGSKLKEIRLKYRMAKSTASYIVNRRTWKDVV